MVVGLGVGTTRARTARAEPRSWRRAAQYDEIAARLTEAFKTLKVGDPHAADTVVGPLVSEAHRNRVLGYIKTGVEEGATVAFGGKHPRAPRAGLVRRADAADERQQRLDGRPRGDLRPRHRR